MIALVSDCLNDARSMLGDDSGQVYTNAILLPHFNKANRTVIRAMAGLGDQHFQREVFYVLPLNTSYLLPVTFGVADFMEPIRMEQRGNITSYAVSAASNIANGVRLTTATHTLTSGAQITCNGITGMSGTNGMWGIDVPDTTHVDLLGAVGVGAYVSGGAVVFSMDEFAPLDATNTIEQFQAVSTILPVYTWSDNAFRFVPATVDRQLRIVFWASGPDITATTQSVLVDDMRDILATLAGGYAARSRGATDKAQMLLSEALGPNQNEDSPDGLLLQKIRTAVRGMQRIPPEQRRRRPFREPYASGPLVW